MIDLDDLDEVELTVLKTMLLVDFESFVKYFFKAMYGADFIFYPHLKKIVKVLMAVADGRIRRLVINIPPRYGKTEIAVKMFIAWCLTNNPYGKFIHISRSEKLVNQNSVAARDLMRLKIHNKLFPESQLATRGVAEWTTIAKGGLYAVPTEAQIQGFGAGLRGNRTYLDTGSPADGFGGAIIIDDPLKTVDAESDNVRNRLNDRFNDTIASRVNNTTETPIIVIMQRLHDVDLAGYLLGGGSGEPWHSLKMPIVDAAGEPLCSAIHNKDQIKILKKDKRVFYSQYMQSPMVGSGNIFKREHFQYYESSAELPTFFDKLIQSWDFTFKKTDGADNVCGTVWGKKGSRVYLLDLVCKKMSFTEQISYMRIFNDKYPNALAKYVEDKANGSAIIDSLKKEIPGIIPIEPHGSKVERASAVAPLFEAGNVYLPENASYTADYVDEMTKFPKAAHDDQVDSTTMALSNLYDTLSLWDYL